MANLFEHSSPVEHRFFPPIPLAAPNLTFYAVMDDDAAHRSLDAHCRIGYTFAQLDAAAYTEIAEAWGY